MVGSQNSIFAVKDIDWIGELKNNPEQDSDKRVQHCCQEYNGSPQLIQPLFKITMVLSKGDLQPIQGIAHITMSLQSYARNSHDHPITRCSLPCWFPTKKVSEEAGRENDKLIPVSCFQYFFNSRSPIAEDKIPPVLPTVPACSTSFLMCLMWDSCLFPLNDPHSPGVITVTGAAGTAIAKQCRYVTLNLWLDCLSDGSSWTNCNHNLCRTFKKMVNGYGFQTLIR